MAELLHLTEGPLWEAARGIGTYEMSTRGRTLHEEGFIHCSLPHQLPGVAEMLYGAGSRAGAADQDLVVLVIDTGRLSVPVRYEAVAPGGEEFPHIYGPLPVDAVVEVRPWPAEEGTPRMSPTTDPASPSETATGGPVTAVTGASGALGGRVAARLARAGVPVRLLGRDPSRLPAVPGADPAPPAPYGDGEAMRRALAGAHTLFLVSAHESPDRVREHTTAVDAAVAAGVERIVYVSFLGAAPDATFTFARDHWHTEAHIRTADVRYTFLRDSWYLAGLPAMTGTDGVLRGPAGDGRVAAVAHEDIADAATAVLLADTDATGPSHDGRTYDLTGPEAFTLAEAAEELSRVTGRTVTYEPETREEAYASRAGYGAADWEVAGWVTSYEAIAAGEMDTVSDAVPTLTGHPAMDLAGYLRAHPDSYRHLLKRD